MPYTAFLSIMSNNQDPMKSPSSKLLEKKYRIEYVFWQKPGLDGVSGASN